MSVEKVVECKKFQFIRLPLTSTRCSNTALLSYSTRRSHSCWL